MLAFGRKAIVPDQGHGSLDQCSSSGATWSAWPAVDRSSLAERASRSLSASPRPFLRWAGSKRRLLPELVDRLPSRFRVYHEPFLGGGSLFFCLNPPVARLSDSCEALISTYEAVRDNPAAVMRFLAPLDVDRETYYSIRANPSRGRFKRAAEFIYLNKVGWNGLYRVNASGRFNVPFGAPKTNNLLDRDNLRQCSGALARPGVTLASGDFETSLAAVEPGDLVFLDPPYVTRHNENGFVDYNERLFSWSDQERLAEEASRLVDLGATVIVTNAHHEDVLQLFAGFRMSAVGRPSTIASSRAARARVSEAILVGGSACRPPSG